jgi:hypothetical protein
VIKGDSLELAKAVSTFGVEIEAKYAFILNVIVFIVYSVI